MPDESDRWSIGEFALAEGIRSLNHQEQELARVRDRVVNLVGLMATASAFLVGSALGSSARGPAFYVPLATGTLIFLAMFWQASRVLMPIPRWYAKVSPSVLYQDYSRLDGSDRTVALAEFYAEAQDHNELVLATARGRLQACIQLSAALFASWIVLIWLVAG